MRNAIVDQILMERMNRRGGYDGRDYARGDYGRGGYDGRRGRDYGRDYARGGRDGRDGNYLNDWATRNVTVIMMRLSQIFQ